MSKVDLRLDWCSYEAAKYAVEHWHYSKKMPKARLVKIGVWEDGQFIGAVVFGGGANADLGAPYGLTQFETAELVRVALKEHKNTVSKIVSYSIKMIKKEFSKLRLLVSFADPEHNHAGGIYQAMNWIYIGMTEPADEYIFNGERRHGRGLRMTLASYNLQGKNTLERAKQLDPNAKTLKGSSKYRYLFPLDDAMRKQIEPLRKPYPKRESGEIDNAVQSNAQTGGASPTDSLYIEATNG